MKLSVVYAASLCTLFARLIVRLNQWCKLQNFQKPLDIFWTQIERKHSEEYLVLILAVKRKLWAIFLPRVYLKNSKNQENGLKHKLELNLEGI